MGQVYSFTVLIQVVDAIPISESINNKFSPNALYALIAFSYLKCESML